MDWWELPITQEEEEERHNTINYGVQQSWKEHRWARTSKTCYTCRKEICPSEYYQHIAIPLHTEIPYFDYCQEHFQ